MAQRTTLTPSDLYVLLEREFRRRRAPGCRSCFVQLPYRVDARDDEANWGIATPPECGNGCESLFTEIVDEFRAQYDLKAEAGG